MSTTDIMPITDISIISLQGNLSRTTSDTVFFLVLSGALDFHCKESVISASAQDVVMFGPKEEYSAYASGNNLVLILSMRSDFFSLGQSELLGKFICNSVDDRERDYAPLRKLLSQLALTRYESADINGIHQRELSYSLLYYLNRYHYVPLFRSIDNEESSQKYAKRYAQIVSFIEQNFSEPISLDNLANEVFLSPTYLSRFFSKHMGENFRSYLNRVRLEHAYTDLLHSDLTLTAIAYNNGFPNLNTFNQLFQAQYGMSPSQYRSEQKNCAKSVTVSDLQVDSQHYALAEHTLNEMAAQSEDNTTSIRFPHQEVYVVDNVNHSTPIRPIWNSMINLGYASHLKDHNLRAHMELFQREIGFRYGRIQSLLNEDFIPTLPDGSAYNFSYFDRLIASMLSLGLTPFLDLSSRNNYLMISNQSYVYPSTHTEIHQELGPHYLEKVSALIRHCINAFGSSEVEKWGFEIAYTTSEYLVLEESISSFVQRFSKTYQIIKKLLPNALVGGMAHNLALSPDVFRKALAEMEQLKFSPDFISLCGFPYERIADVNGPESHVYSFDQDFLRNQVQIVKSILAEHPTVSQTLYLTVFGIDIKARNPLNDSCYQATFIAKNIFDLLGLVDLVGYWQLSDLATEYTDSRRFLFGGNGIINKSGLKKPGFTIFKRMKNLSSRLLQRGSDHIITTDGRNSYQAIVCNYVHYSDAFCLGDPSTVPVEEVYSAFTDLSTKDLTIQFNQLPQGRYRVTTTTLNRDSGSLLDEWLRYGILDDLQLRDVHYFEDIVHPNRTARHVDCQNGVLELHAQLLPHEVRYFEITLEL